MSLFLIVFFTLYGSLQAYIFWKVHAAYKLRGWSLAAVIAFLVLMLLGPILVRRLDQAGWFRAAQAFGLLTYWWMAVSMWVFCFGLLGDLWNFGALGVSLIRPGAKEFILPARWIAPILGGLIVALTVWGAIEIRMIRLNTFTLDTSRLTPGSNPIRIVQISDVHLGLLLRRGALERIRRVVEKAEPDVLVCTGDLVDATGSHMDELNGILAGMEAPLGKFAVTGNHEYYAGLEGSVRFTENSGFRMLRQESVIVDGRIRFVGVDDPSGRRMEEKSRLDEDACLPPADRAEYTVLLKHRPQVKEASLGRFDLQLSGHTHGGQIFPFTEIERLEYGDRRNGFFALPQNAHLYITRGTGAWGPPLRVLARPEVSLFVIRPAKR